MIGNKKHFFIVIILAIYLLLPLIGTLLYSLAGKWSNTVLPESWTLSWYTMLFQDQRFLEALSRSIFVITSSVVLSLVVMLLAIFVMLIYFPSMEKYLKLVSMIPYGVPAVASAIGLLNIYSSSSINIIGTPWILIGSYAIIILPFVYQGIRNSLYTVNAVELIQAAELLGATKVKAVITVVLPNIMKGILSAVLLAIAMLFGEFALANLLVGGRYETLQLYLYQQFSKNGHLTSAIVISYYVIIMAVTGLLLQFQQPGKKKVTFAALRKPVIRKNQIQKNSVEGDIS
ncbi:ABC transporter permease [Oceanobacillus salinisoli]|uniref:ABC transporter permease n=1 Tax=Oceanobacillus salinisoli TaxID=2678611 RepID=UPI0012E0EF12|nr:ABC transporter permease subunit [Oceanobacillus salinisoli]